MSPKVVLMCFAGMGGTTGAYALYSYTQHEKEQEDVIVPKKIIKVKQLTNTTPIAKSTAKCTNPTHQVTIKGDDAVEYYVCTETTALTGTKTNITSTVVIEEIHNFKQIDATAPTASTPKIISTKGTYTPKGETPAINFHGLQEIPSKTTFFIEKPDTTGTPSQDWSKDNKIEELVGKIEKLRNGRIITTTTSTTQTIDSISCTDPKKLTNNHTKAVEYYSCATITGEVNGTDDAPTATSEQTTFIPVDAFKTKTGTNHTITKGSKKDETTTYFYGFKPKTDDGTHQTTFFFIASSNGSLEDTKAQKIVEELEIFYNQQTTLKKS